MEGEKGKESLRWNQYNARLVLYFNIIKFWILYGASYFCFSFWFLSPLNDLIIAWAKSIPGKQNNMRRELQEEQHSWSENLEVGSGK